MKRKRRLGLSLIDVDDSLKTAVRKCETETRTADERNACALGVRFVREELYYHEGRSRTTPPRMSGKRRR